MPPLLDPSDIIVASWNNYRKNFGTYSVLVVWYALIAVVVWALWTMCTAMFDSAVTRDATFAALGLPCAFGVAMLTAMMIDATSKGVQGKSIELRDSFQRAFHQVFPLIWAFILLGFTWAAGLILLIVPFVVFAVWFRFVQYAVVIDDVRGFAAFGASRRLSRGRWGAVAARVFVPVIFFSVAVSFVRAVAFFIAGFASGSPGLFFGASQGIVTLTTSQGLITTILPQIITAFALPLFVGADMTLWYELKKRSQ